MNQREAAQDPLAHVDEHRRLTADVDRRTRRRDDRGQHVTPKPVDELRRRFVLRPGGRSDLDHRGVTARTDDRGARLSDAGVGFHRTLDRGERGIVAGRAREVDREHERPVEAGAEAFGQEVIAATQRRARRVLARIGLAEAHGEERRGEHEHDGQPGDQVDDRVRRHVVSPSRPAVVAAVGVARAGLAHSLRAGKAEAVDVVAREADERGQQGERGDHHDRDDERGADAHEGDERDARDGEPEDRDHDGAARDHDGLSGGRDRAPDCVFDGESPVQAGSVPRDDEQRVVDADAEPDHRREHLSGRPAGR